jgi:hypothetical protein
MPSSRRLVPFNLNFSLHLAKAGALAAAALALTGCQTYTAQTQSRSDALRSGDIASAVAIADRDAEKNAATKDALLYRLEQGAILRSAALANIPAPAARPAAPATDGQTQTNQALLSVPPEEIAPRIAYLTRSLSAFNEAIRRVDEYEAAAKISVGSEAGAILTNQANLPYRGRAYDKVMLHTYQAINYLQLADPDAARVELNRALQRQRDAVDANAKRIAEAQKLAAESKTGSVKDEQGRSGSGYDVDRAKSDPKTAAGIGNIESKFNSAILPYGDYVNPFTTFLDALVFTHQGADASDLERARKSWERVVNFAPANPYARADYADVEPDVRPAPAAPLSPEPLPEATPPAAPEAAPAPEASPASTSPAVAVTETAVVATEPAAALPATPDPVAVAVAETPAVAADTPVAPAPLPPQPVPAAPSAITYVIFETGSAPYREQIRIDLPLFLVTSGVSYVGMALPQLETVGGHAPALTIATNDGQSLNTALIASMDSVVAQDFKNEWPSILTKTIISTGTKATIDAIVQKQINDQLGAGWGFAAKLATAALQASVNIADTRTWRTLPKEFQYARLATPADLQLVVSTGGTSQTLNLEPAAVQVVYVKSPSANSPLLVGQFILKK